MKTFLTNVTKSARVDRLKDIKNLFKSIYHQLPKKIAERQMFK